MFIRCSSLGAFAFLLVTNAPAQDPKQRIQALEETLEEVEEEIAELLDLAGTTKPGSTTFLVAGTASVKYTDKEGKVGSYASVFSPHFLWKLNERAFIETHIDFALMDDETDLNMAFFNFSYLVHDNVMLRAGKILSPFGFFQEGVHTAWINRLPDEPLALADDGLAPTADLAAEIRGAVPLDSMKFKYSVYVGNGPRLKTGSSKREDAGTLQFNNHVDNNNSKSIGGRIAWLPVPAVEIGYSFLTARVGDSAFQDVEAFLQGVDVNFNGDIDAINGTIDARAEWVWSDISSTAYPGAAGGPLASFDNKRNGGYIQLAYRPSQIEMDVIPDLELVGRYDTLNQPSGAPVFDTTRWTLGLNYWFGPSFVMKLAQQFEDPEGGSTEMSTFFQVAIGF